MSVHASITPLARYTVMRRLLLACVLAGCGGAALDNSLLSRPSRLSAVGAPDLHVLVTTSVALERVSLRTGAHEVVSARPLTKTDDGRVRVFEEQGHYVVRRDGQADLVLADVPVTRFRPDLNAEGTLLAVLDDGTRLELRPPTVILADLTTGAVRRFSVPANVQFIVSIEGTTAIWLSPPGLGYLRIDLETGAVTDSPTGPDRDRMAAGAALAAEGGGSADCPARGLRLETESSHGHDRLMLVPFASTADPERLVLTAARVLIDAEDNDIHPHRNPFPRTFGTMFFTPSCEHFVFEFGESIYVGNVETGAYAYIAHGHEVRLTD